MQCRPFTGQGALSFSLNCPDISGKPEAIAQTIMQYLIGRKVIRFSTRQLHLAESTRAIESEDDYWIERVCRLSV
jgi:hypothetical protein